MFAQTRSSLDSIRRRRAGRVEPGGVPGYLVDSLPDPVLHAEWSKLGPVPMEGTLATIFASQGA